MEFEEQLYCNNCGKTDHIYKKCKEPITSFGIICFKCTGKTKKYVMIRRKFSYTFVEFLRAKYDLLKPSYIQTLFDHMTMYEKELIKKNKFNILWNKLWYIKNKNEKTRNHSDFYKGIIKFNILKNGYFVEDKYYNTNHFIFNSKKN
jgi:hypothetical protein